MNIKPISELRNYNSVLNECKPGEPVYLTKRGHGAYALVDIQEHTETERLKSTIRLLNELNKGEARAREEGWLTEEQVFNDEVSAEDV